MCSAINFCLGNSSRDSPAGSCEQDVLAWMLCSGGCWDAAIRHSQLCGVAVQPARRLGHGITETWNALSGKGP